MHGTSQLTVEWPSISNEHGDAMLWLGAWLIGDKGAEGEWFHSGRGGAQPRRDVPAAATGIRLRRWPNEGLAPEYAALIPITALQVNAAAVSFEREQPFSMLADHIA